MQCGRCKGSGCYSCDETGLVGVDHAKPGSEQTVLVVIADVEYNVGPGLARAIKSYIQHADPDAYLQRRLPNIAKQRVTFPLVGECGPESIVPKSRTVTVKLNGGDILKRIVDDAEPGIIDAVKRAMRNGSYGKFATGGVVKSQRQLLTGKAPHAIIADDLGPPKRDEQGEPIAAMRAPAPGTLAADNFGDIARRMETLGLERSTPPDDNALWPETVADYCAEDVRMFGGDHMETRREINARIFGEYGSELDP